jgi:hypothetical protein
VTLNQIAALAADSTFRSQVQSAAVNYAHTVLSSAPTANNLLDEARWGLAQAVLVDGGAALQSRFAWGLAAYPGFTGALNDAADNNDAAINSVIQTAWNDLALTNGGVIAKGL